MGSILNVFGVFEAPFRFLPFSGSTYSATVVHLVSKYRPGLNLALIARQVPRCDEVRGWIQGKIVRRGVVVDGQSAVVSRASVVV